MSGKIKLSVGFITSLVMVFGFLVLSEGGASAQYAVPTCNSATLNGFVDPNGKATAVWFEWGRATSLGFSTSPQTFTQPSTFSSTITGLTENTTYYYRAMAQNSSGKSTGNTISFTTSTCNTTPPPQPPPPPPPPPAQNVTVTLSSSHSGVPSGGFTTLTWTTTGNPTQCIAQNDWSGNKSANGGSESVGPLTRTSSPYLFAITCSNSTSGDSDFVNVSVNFTPPPPPVPPPQPPPPQPPPPPPPPQPLPTVNLTANPSTINRGDFSSLSWNSTNTNSCDFGPEGGSTTRYGGFGGINVSPSQTTSYKVTCFNSAGTASDRETVTVIQPPSPPPPPPPPPPQPPPTPKPVVNLSADQTFVNFGGATVVRWFPTNNPTSCTGLGGTNDWGGPKITGNGSFYTGALFSTTTFSMYCSNSAGTSNPESVTVAVGNQPQPPQPPPPPPVPPPQPPPPQPPPPPPPPAPGQPSVTITADDTSLDEGENTIVRWDSSNATSCTGFDGANSWSGAKTLDGSFFTGTLSSTKTFSISCFNSAGVSDSDSVTINVRQDNDNDGGNVSVRITADDTSIDEGDSTRVRWTSEDADFCEGEDGDNGWNNRDLDTDGSFNTGDLDRDTTFRITCFGDGGERDSDSVTINVDRGKSRDISVRLTADDTSIRSGDSVRLSWDTDNAELCEGRNGTSDWDGRDLDEDGGSFRTRSINRDTTFRITCENRDGDEDSDSVTIRILDDSGGIDSGNAPTAITTSAINITITSAQLNSLILNSSTSSASAWFEWGLTPSLGSATPRNSVGTAASVSHSATVTGLLPGRVYYYRAVAENAFGQGTGSVLSFITSEVAGVATPPPTTIVRPTTTIVTRGVSTSSLVKLSIDGGAELITLGEKRYYHVEWENISNQTLEDVVLRVILPGTMIFEGTNKGEFSPADNSLNLDLGNLRSGDGDDLFLAASVRPGTKDGEVIVVVANLVYTETSGVQGDATAYASHRVGVGDGSVLGASALFGAGFLPDSFFGWLILIILILILVALLRYLFAQSRDQRPPQPAV